MRALIACESWRTRAKAASALDTEPQGEVRVKCDHRSASAM
jgi:hypothetical protein